METKNRVAVIFSLAALMLASAACGGKHGAQTVQNEEPVPANTGAAKPPVAPVLAMSDPQAATQLITGFYALEQNSWRWTAGRFSAVLAAPPRAEQTGGTLSFGFTIPDAIFSRLGPLTLTAASGGTVLHAETYKAAGKYTFHADVPAALLAAGSLKVDFALDKSIPPGTSGDRRELGVIASSLGIEVK